MTGEHKSGTGDALGKSPVYSPLGSGAHEVGHSHIHGIFHASCFPLSFGVSALFRSWHAGQNTGWRIVFDCITMQWALHLQSVVFWCYLESLS